MQMLEKKARRGAGRRWEEREVSCSSVTCILVRVRPKDVVHTADFTGRSRRRGKRRRDAKKSEEGTKERWAKVSEKEIAEEEEDPSCVLLNGVDVSSRGMWRSKF